MREACWIEVLPVWLEYGYKIHLNIIKVNSLKAACQLKIKQKMMNLLHVINDTRPHRKPIRWTGFQCRFIGTLLLNSQSEIFAPQYVSRSVQFSNSTRFRSDQNVIITLYTAHCCVYVMSYILAPNSKPSTPHL